MSYKIQITVDEQLNNTIKEKADQMGLSVSSYARLVLKTLLPNHGKSQLDKSIDDITHNRVEEISLETFKNQLHHL